MVSFKVTKKQSALISQIAERANKELFSGTTIPQSVMDTEMDLCAVIAQGEKLDLEKLLAFDAFNFGHDIGGIYRHINRDTGKLERCFLPRCARQEATK